jgi:LuxR family maltose regulon positive regulatory protein
MKKITKYPCTLVEAPMGYGKTTIVREYLKKIDGQVLWLKIYDDSISSFWFNFCSLFSRIDEGCSQSLLKIGFPNDSESMEKVIHLIKKIATPSKIFIVLDDYHLIDSEDVNSFIELFLCKEITNIYIVLTARFTRLYNLEELKLKGYLNHIKKEMLEFSPEDIVNYYKLCGINIKKNEGNKYYIYTEGWVSALYLLMLNFNEKDKFSTDANITKLIEEAVYIKFSDEIKEFLLNICFLDCFTLKQAEHMWQNVNTEKLLTEIINKNAFVYYDEKTKVYQIHKMFSDFLKDILEGKKDEYKNCLYQKAARWYIDSGDYITAMRYFYTSMDYESLLIALEKDKGHSLYNDQKAMLIQCFEDCPMEIKLHHPVALLVYALCLFSFNETELFDIVCKELVIALQYNDNLSINNAKEIMGEFELLLCFTEYNDIMKMYEHIKKSYELLQHPATFIDSRDGWTFGSPSVLYMFHRSVGDLENEVRYLKESMPLYNQLTKGHGKGGEYVMEAERYFNCGNFDNSEISVHRALSYAISAKQEDIILCAIFLESRIAIVKNDYAHGVHILQKLRKEIEDKKCYNLMHSLDLCEAYFQIIFQKAEGIPEWITDGDFNSSRLYFPARSFLNIVYGRVLLIKGEYLKLLGISDQFIDLASVFPNLLGQIYSFIYIAASNEKIYRRDKALEALNKALGISLPDNIYMPFVENCDYIKPLLEEIKNHGAFMKQINDILKIYESYEKSIQKITKKYFKQIKIELTEREMEIVQLVIRGMSNNEIGRSLYISENTVKTILKRVFEKFNISSRAMLKQYFEQEQ